MLKILLIHGLVMELIEQLQLVLLLNLVQLGLFLLIQLTFKDQMLQVGGLEYKLEKEMVH